MTIDKKLVKELAALLKENDLNEIEYDTKEFSIKVVRSGPAPIHAQVSAPIAQTPAAAPKPEAAPAEETGEVVRSPMVGVLYHAPESGALPYIKVGDTVKKGQTLFLIEAMKTFNPVKAPNSGKIKKILVGNAKPVEFDEPLVIME